MMGLFRKHRQIIAADVLDKMEAMGECPNTIDVIVGTISPKDFPCPDTVHCHIDCFRTDCPTYKFIKELKEYDNP